MWLAKQIVDRVARLYGTWVSCRNILTTTWLLLPLLMKGYWWNYVYFMAPMSRVGVKSRLICWSEYAQFKTSDEGRITKGSFQYSLIAVIKWTERHFWFKKFENFAIYWELKALQSDLSSHCFCSFSFCSLDLQLPHYRKHSHLLIPVEKPASHLIQSLRVRMIR